MKSTRGGAGSGTRRGAERPRAGAERPLNGATVTPAPYTQNVFTLPFAVSYEADLFGGLRRLLFVERRSSAGPVVQQLTLTPRSVKKRF